MSYGTYHFNHCFACLLSYLEQRVLLPWSYFYHPYLAPAHDSIVEILGLRSAIPLR